jgi:hypothetical protein
LAKQLDWNQIDIGCLPRVLFGVAMVASILAIVALVDSRYSKLWTVGGFLVFVICLVLIIRIGVGSRADAARRKRSLGPYYDRGMICSQHGIVFDPATKATAPIGNWDQIIDAFDDQ